MGSGSTRPVPVNTTIATTTDTYWRKHYTARPAALGAWTAAAINDLRERQKAGELDVRGERDLPDHRRAAAGRRDDRG